MANKPKTIVDILSSIQKELHVPKNRHNNFGNYNYRNAEDIVDAVKKILPDGVIFTITDKIELIGDRYYVKSTATISYGEQAIFVDGWAREANEKRGMDPSQLTGATSSYARKYALNGLFAIDDGVDADSSDNREQQPIKKPTSKPDVFKKSGVSQAQIKRLFAISNSKKLSQGELKQIMKQIAGVESTSELTKETYDKLCNAIEAM